jgi:hypothetical protein
MREGEGGGIPPRHGIVAILDALGTRGRWQSDEPSDLVKRMTEVYSYAVSEFMEDAFYKGYLENVSKTLVAVKWDARFLSDSLLVTGDYVGPLDSLFNQLANHLIGIFDFAVAEGFLLRGAFALGTFYQAGGIIVGPAVDEAAWWAEEGDWAGVIATPTASSALDSVERPNPAALIGEFARWEAPLKDRRPIKTWALWWPRTGKRKRIEELLLRPPVLEDVGRKRLNTLAFYDEMTSRFKVGVAGEL